MEVYFHSFLTRGQSLSTHWIWGWVGIKIWSARFWQWIYLSLIFKLTSAYFSEAANPNGCSCRQEKTYFAKNKHTTLAFECGISDNLNYLYTIFKLDPVITRHLEYNENNKYGTISTRMVRDEQSMMWVERSLICLNCFSYWFKKEMKYKMLNGYKKK